MALTPGTRLGPYEIAAQIGVGGMGEVYRAIDAKLDRFQAQQRVRFVLVPLASRVMLFTRDVWGPPVRTV